MPKRRARGEGTIYQRKDGLWSAQITLPDGRRQTKYSRSQREVRDWLSEQRGQIRRGVWSSDSSTTVQEFVDRYLNDVAAHKVREQTLNVYRNYAVRYIYPHLGRTRLAQLRPEQVQRLYTTLTSGGLAPGTVQIVHNVLGQALEQAVRWGLASLNAARLAHAPTNRRKVPELLTDEQLRLVLDSMRGYWLRTVAIIAVGTGMRRGEIAGLMWDCVDLPGAEIRVERNVVEHPGGAHTIAEPKTASSRRRISIPQFVVSTLEEHREQHGAEGLLFRRKDGRPLRPRLIDEAWQSKMRQHNLPQVRFHSLRHLHATKLLMAGISAKVVQERLGHANIALTLGTYSHVTPGLEREAAEAVQRTTANLLLTR